MGQFDCLKLENQLCFSLYACSKEIVRRYKPLLAQLDLTYTQYLTMMVLWEVEETNVKDLGQRLYLDSGTLTPVLKKLEHKGYISRERSSQDERNLVIRITEAGRRLREKAVSFPETMGHCVDISEADAAELSRILDQMLCNVEKSREAQIEREDK